eukprot:CAMPEP_0195264372 /NCGR_PEP_ID=MMETSP0706-20130129/10821_1 /TAXON_ID=33640 /ORGANISM="Asterionellopsis glacialis, Strain CCMP134" /LENGTH=297 /DNA_ID=CAMNT_0040318651 /DNA_START=70 /DNA_END=963 /DNA_ORIENTATION=+
MKLYSIIAVLALGSRSTYASPTGAASCLPGVPFASTSPHLLAPQGEELSENGFEVFLNDEKLDADSTYTVTTGEEYTLKLTGSAFKGFLVRIGESSAALTPTSPGVQDAEVCGDGVAGVTHMDNNEKQEISATLKVDEAGTDIAMDITVVIVLIFSQESVWHNSRFVINAEDPPTPDPSSSPSSAPSLSSSPSSSASISSVPSSSPSSYPSSAPSSPPSLYPSSAPSSSPSLSASSPPSLYPSSPPSVSPFFSAPSLSPSLYPSSTPTPTSGGDGPFIQVVTLVSFGVASAVFLSMM